MLVVYQPTMRGEAVMRRRSFLDRKMDRSLVLMLGLLVISRIGDPMGDG